MNISDFGTEANTIDQQVADVKAYALANYNARGWDFIVETLSDEDLAVVIGKRKNSRAAINAAYAYIKPLHEHRAEQLANAKIEREVALATVANEATVDVVTEASNIEKLGAALQANADDAAEAKRAKRTAAQKARRAAARAAKA